MQLSSNARKAVAVGLAASTILWASIGVIPMFASAAVHSDGCLVLSGGIVWMITNGTRRGYTSAEVFQSYGYNFSQVVAATAEDVALPVGPIMIYADGTLVKGPSDPLVYLVAAGQKRGFVSGSVFLGLGYSFANIQSAPSNTFADLPTGANLDSTTIAHPAGTQVISNGAIWWMDNNGRRGFSTAAIFQSYGYMFSHVVAANAADLASPNLGDVPARAACTGGNPPPSGSISVTLASDNPVSGTLVATQSLADLAHFTFSGSGTLVALTFQRIGVSANGTLSNVFLFDGATRLTDSATVSSDNTVTFAGLNLAVSGSRTIAFKSDILTGTSGQTVGIKLTSYTVSGLPAAVVSVSGNIHSIATASLATVALSSAAGTFTDPAKDVNVWQGTVTIGVRDVTLNRLALRQIGSIQAVDIVNFRLQIDGVQVAQTQSLDSNNYVTFTPNVLVKTGTRTFKVIADVNGGSSRTVQMSFRGAYDIGATDSNYSVPVLATGVFPFGPAASTVAAGSLTVAKASDSPSANLVVGASDVSVGKWTFTAYGETVKVETLTVGVDTNGTDASNSFRNVKIMVDGAQVGSTTSVVAAASYATGTSFTTNFYVNPGTPRIVEVHADMVDDTTPDLIAALTTNTIQFALVTVADNGIPQVSLTPIDVPTASVPANSMTIATGTTTLAATSNYPAQTIASPQTAYKIASFTLTGNATEAVNVNTFTMSMTVVDNAAAGPCTFADVTDVYIMYGSTSTGVKPTVAATLNSWSPSFTLGVNQSMQIDVYGTIGSECGATDTILASLKVNGVTALSGTATTTSGDVVLAGQTITIAAGTLTATLDPSAPIAQLVDDSGTVTTGAFKVAAVTDSFSITDVTVTLGSTTNVSSITLLDGATPLVTHPATSLTFSGLNILVPANTTKILSTQLALSSIGVGAGTTDANLTTALTAFTARNSAGTSAGGTIGTPTPTGATMYAYKAVPLVSALALPNSALTATEMVLAKFSVSSNGTGQVAWKQVMFEITKSTAPIVGAAALYNADTGVAITAASVYQNSELTGGGGVATTCSSDVNTCELLLTVGTNTNDSVMEQVSGAKNYEVRATISGTLASGNSVSAKLDRNTVTHVASGLEQAVDNSLAAGNVSFVWSDESNSVTNSTAVATWQGDFLVKNLPITWSLSRS